MSNPLDISHIPLPSSGREIFNRSFWINEKAYNAITDIENRKEAESIMLFGQTYFPEHFPSLHPTLHTDILALFCDKNERLKDSSVPRGHSKSTLVSFLLAMYRICFQKKKFIVIVSDSEDKAKDFAIRLRDELEHNKELINDFSLDGFKTTDWSKTDFVTKTGIRVVAKGSNQSLRGLIHLDTRPDSIILDDIETNETAGTDSILNFILTDVIPSANRRGDYDICYVGTIIKDMSCLHRMAINPQWASVKWECIDDDGEMIAPMLLPKEEYENAKKMYQELGKMSIFYAENHNNPLVADDEATFKQTFFKHVEKEPNGCNYYIAYDPALPPSGRTKIKKVDRSAIIVLATDSNQNWYVVKVFANRDTPAKNRELIYNLCRKYNPKTIWMETIAAQRGMYLEIRDNKPKDINLPLREIASHSGSKEARIEQLQPFYETGRIFHINKTDKEIVELERELLLFGRTPHDDRSDCLSFFINKVKYPKEGTTSINRLIDEWADILNGNNGDTWKTV